MILGRSDRTSRDPGGPAGRPSCEPPDMNLPVLWGTAVPWRETFLGFRFLQLRSTGGRREDASLLLLQKASYLVT